MKTKLNVEVRESLNRETFQNFNDFKTRLLINHLPCDNTHSMMAKAASDFQKSQENVLSFILRLKKCKRHINYILLVEPNPILTDKLNGYFITCLKRGLDPQISQVFCRIIETIKLSIDFNDACMLAIMIEKDYSLDSFLQSIESKTQQPQKTHISNNVCENNVCEIKS